MKIWVISQKDQEKGGGGEKTTFQTCRELSRRGNEVKWFCGRGSNQKKIEKFSKFRIFRLGKENTETGKFSFLSVFFYIFFILDLSIKLIRVKECPDVVLTIGISTLPVGKIVGMVKRKPVLNFINSYNGFIWFEWLSFPRAVLYLTGEVTFLILFHGKGILCRNNKTRRKLERLTTCQCKVAYGVLDKEIFFKVNREMSEKSLSLDFNCPEELGFFIFVGRLVPIKNVLELVSVFKNLNENLLIVGDGPLRKNIESLSDSESNIKVLGEKDYKTALKLIAKSKALILPSEREEYPRTVLEAITLGRPVFSRKLGVLPELKLKSEIKCFKSFAELSELLKKSESEPFKKIEREFLETHSIENFVDEVEKNLREIC